MKLRLPRRRIWRAAIYLLSTLLVLIAIDMVMIQMRRKIEPGYETTRIVAPVREDGSIDYMLAIDGYFGEGITPQNNAAPLILQALGRAALSKNQPEDGITGKLGMGHLPAAGDYFVMHEEYARKHGGGIDDADDVAAATAWPGEIKPVSREWVAANEKPLAVLAEASRRPKYFIPFYGGNRPETLMEVLLPQVNLLRESAAALLTRAVMRLNGGDVAGFREDVLTAHRLARLLGQSPTIIERIVAAKRIEIPACQIERLAAEAGKLPPADARAMAADLAAMPDLPGITDCMDVAERFMVLDAMQAMARMGPVRAGRLLDAVAGPDSRVPPGMAFRMLPVPYEETMRVINHFNDGALAATRQPTYRRRIAALKQWESEIGKLASKNRISIVLSAEWPAPVFMPSLIVAGQTGDRARMESRLTRVALGLAAFKAERGGYPGSLEELAPAYLGEVPADLFSDGPLVYRRTAGGCVVYSVGSNMADDGGKSDGPEDDIVAEFPAGAATRPGR